MKLTIFNLLLLAGLCFLIFDSKDSQVIDKISNKVSSKVSGLSKIPKKAKLLLGSKNKQPRKNSYSIGVGQDYRFRRLENKNIKGQKTFLQEKLSSNHATPKSKEDKLINLNGRKSEIKVKEVYLKESNIQVKKKIASTKGKVKKNRNNKEKLKNKLVKKLKRTYQLKDLSEEMEFLAIKLKP